MFIFHLFCDILAFYGQYKCNLSTIFRMSRCSWVDSFLHWLLCNWSNRSCWSCWWVWKKILIFFFNLIQNFPLFPGYICCTVTIIFFAAPCCMIADVIKKRSAEMLPMPLILMSFISSVQWLAFGMIAKDLFIQIPNLLGAILSGMQLSLFCIYPQKTRLSAASSNSEVPYAIF